MTVGDRERSEDRAANTREHQNRSESKPPQTNAPRTTVAPIVTRHNHARWRLVTISGHSQGLRPTSDLLDRRRRIASVDRTVAGRSAETRFALREVERHSPKCLPEGRSQRTSKRSALLSRPSTATTGGREASQMDEQRERATAGDTLQPYTNHRSASAALTFGLVPAAVKNTCDGSRLRAHAVDLRPLRGEQWATLGQYPRFRKRRR